MTRAITIAMADQAVAVDGDPMLLEYLESRYLTVPVTNARPDASIELVLGVGRRPDPGSRCTWIEIEESALTVDDQMARLWVQPDDYRYILSFLVPLAIAHLAAPRGWVALHAAAVAGERTVLLIGPTGVGKSTLSLLATRHGYEVLGDDQVLARLRDGSVEVAGVGRRVAAPASFVRSCGHHGLVMAKDPRRRVMVDSLPLARGWRPLAGSILLGGHDDNTPRMAGARYFGHLLESAWVASRPELLAPLTKILRAVAEAPTATIAPVIGHPTDAAWNRIVTMLESE